MTARTHLLLVSLLAVGMQAGDASAAFITYDLTGTWTGSLKCAAFSGGIKQKFVVTPVMKISQLGLDLGVQLDLGTGTVRYGGLANPDLKKPEQKGEAALLRCGTDNVLGDGIDEIVRMVASTKPGKVKASFKGVSIISFSNAVIPSHGTCKWKWTRTDSVDPNLLTHCDEPIVGLPSTGGAR